MLEEKNYKVKIIGSFTGVSSEKKTPYIGLELETSCGNFIDWVSYMTEKTASRALKTLVDSGFRGKKIADLSNGSLDIDDLFEENQALSIVVEHEEWTTDDGEIKKKAKVKWLNTGSGGVSKLDHKTAVKTFSETPYDGMMKELMNNLPTKKAKTKTENEGSENEEDLPF